MSNDNITRSVPFRIIIVGAGVAGLATAHYLERANKEGKATSNSRVTVYECNKEEEGYNGYPIQLTHDAREALRTILSPSSYAQLISQSEYGITHDGLCILTPELSHLYTTNDKDEKEHGQPPWVNPKVLKDLLFQGVEVIRGKRVVRFRELENKVEVVFEDGSIELADLVIGADGIGSTLRAQLHPPLTHFPILPYINIQFKLASPISKLPDGIVKNTSNLVLGNQSYSLYIIPITAKHELPVDLPPRSAIKLSESGPFSQLTPDENMKVLRIQDELSTNPDLSFVYCRMIISSEKIGQGWEDLIDAAWIEKILHILQQDHTNPELVKLIENYIIPGSLNTSNIVSTQIGVEHQLPFREGKVVLVGDAMHVLPPTCGAGAAIALKDAQVLVDTLLSSSELNGKDGQLSELLPINHHASTQRFNDHLKESIHCLEISNQSGLSGFIHRSKLRSLDLLKMF